MIAPVKPPLSVVWVICAPVATGWRAIWPTTCDGWVKAPGEIAGGLDGQHPADRLDPGRQRDVRCGDEDRTVGGCLSRPSVGWSPDKQQDPHEGYDRQEDPDEQDEPI